MGVARICHRRGSKLRIQATPTRPELAAPARGTRLWDDYVAQVGEGSQISSDWDLAVQAAPEFEVDQRLSWSGRKAAASPALWVRLRRPLQISRLSYKRLTVGGSACSNCTDQQRLAALNLRHTSLHAFDFNFLSVLIEDEHGNIGVPILRDVFVPLSR